MRRCCGLCGELGHNRKTCERPWTRRSIPEAEKSFEKDETTRPAAVEDDSADPDVDEFFNREVQKEVYLKEIDRCEQTIKETMKHIDFIWMKIARLSLEKTK